MKTAIALLRVSTADQLLGVEAQRADIERYAREHGIDVLQFHTEVVSGGAPLEERLGLLAACEEISLRRVDHLLVAKRDRLARDPLVAMLTETTLAKVGASVLAADGNNADDPASELLRHILDAVARFERRMIAIRTKAALSVLAASGVKLGRPVGSKDKGYRKRRKDAGVKRGPNARTREPVISSAQTFHSEPGNA